VAVEFGPPGPELSQGDLVALVPSNYVHDLDYLVKIDANPVRFQVRATRPEHMHDDQMHQANARGVRAAGIVLTHDCEIDKDDRERASILVGLVRPLAGIREVDRDGIRQNTRHRAFYLPANTHVGQESYVDLRRITSVRRAALEQLVRNAAMSEDGRLMLQEHLFRFFTRRLLPDTWREWEEEDAGGAPAA
jgi:hypothetical protein